MVSVNNRVPTTAAKVTSTAIPASTENPTATTGLTNTSGVPTSQNTLVYTSKAPGTPDTPSTANATCSPGATGSPGVTGSPNVEATMYRPSEALSMLDTAFNNWMSRAEAKLNQGKQSGYFNYEEAKNNYIQAKNTIRTNIQQLKDNVNTAHQKASTLYKQNLSYSPSEGANLQNASEVEAAQQKLQEAIAKVITYCNDLNNADMSFIYAGV